MTSQMDKWKGGRKEGHLTPVKLKNFFFKNSYLNIWMSIRRRFLVGPVTAPAKGSAELSPIVVGQVATSGSYLTKAKVSGNASRT